MHSRSHLGIGFELWSNQRVWFWSVVNPPGNGGAIGAATTEAEAVREACTVIEELSVQRRFASQSRPPKAPFSPPLIRQIRLPWLWAIGRRWSATPSDIQFFL
jgi:hypothetical protein